MGTDSSYFQIVLQQGVTSAASAEAVAGAPHTDKKDSAPDAAGLLAELTEKQREVLSKRSNEGMPGCRGG